MLKSRLARYIIPLSVLVCGCSDKDMPYGPDPSELTVDTEEIGLPVRSSYRTIKVTVGDNDYKTLEASASGPWLEVLGDSVSHDGYLEVFAERNENPSKRTGEIVLRKADGPEIRIPVTQAGYQDDDSNGGLYCYAGCGYNIFQEINSESSICEPIVDYQEAARIDPTIVQTTSRNLQDIVSVTSNSTTEMAELMTKTMEKKESGLIGGKKTITRFESQSGQTRLDVTHFAYINLQRLVACSSLDHSKLIQYAEQNRMGIFTKEFRTHYERILANPSVGNVQELFKVFGTHIVSYVDLGGTMDVALRFNKTMRGELNIRVNDFVKYFFKSQPSDYTLNGEIQGLSSDVSEKGTFKVAGGSHDARESILSDCRRQGRISPSNILAWTRSLPNSDFMNPDNLAKMVPFNVQLVPIWTLFPQRLTQTFVECAIAESQKSTNAIDDAKAGLDNYGLKINGAPYMDFAEGNDESLVRVLYAAQGNISEASPILEICNEYVPSVKANKRITVIYPIRKGRPFHGSGLFPGDGEGTAPAWLTFSDGDVYVKPVEGMDGRSKIDSVYYLHGNIYLTSLGLDLRRSVSTDWKPKGIIGLPIVKIGSGYWTRKNVNKDIAAGFYTGSSFSRGTYRTKDGEYWVQVRGVTHTRLAPPGISSKTDDVYGEPLEWYYPTDKARAALLNYVNFDTRHLLKGQLSGFDLQFNGYYGPGGIDGADASKKSSYHNTDRSYLIFKDKIDSETGSALCMDADYRWRTVSTGNGLNNFFPLRLYRSSYYFYDRYSNAKDNL